MIDVRRLRFDGKFNYQNGLTFYFSRHGHVISFLVQRIGDRKRWIKVTMQPDPNHDRAHVHIDGEDNHGPSFAIDTGELLGGKCDARTRACVERWINSHKHDLLKLWEIAKAGSDYRPMVDKIRRDKSFEEYGFKGEEPEMEVIDGVKIWYEGEITAGRNDNGIIEVTSEGNMYVGLPSDYKDGSMVFQSIDGKVVVRR